MIVSFTSKCKTKRRHFDIEGGEASTMALIVAGEMAKKSPGIGKKLIAVGWLLFSHKAVKGSDGKISYTHDRKQQNLVKK